MKEESHLFSVAERWECQEGPIDYIDSNTGEEGPEGRINAWPMNEAFIDYGDFSRSLKKSK